MCDFRGSNRQDRSFLAEHLCHRLRFFSLEAANRVVLWPKSQVPVATTDYSGGVHQAIAGFAKGGHESSPTLQCWATFAMSLAGRDSPRQSFTQLVSLCSSRSTGKHQSRFTLYFDALIGAEMSCESASGPSKDFPLRIPLEYPTFVRAA